MLPVQSFAGNSLHRAVDAQKQPLYGATDVVLIPVAGREVCARAAPLELPKLTRTPPSTTSFPRLPGLDHLQVLLFNPLSTPDLDLNDHCLSWSDEGDNGSTTDNTPPHRLPLYQLGQEQHTGRWVFAVDISGPHKQDFLDHMRAAWSLEVAMVDLRKLMAGFTAEACAIAGQAVALSQWHQAHTFCQRCGERTQPTQAGLRRSCRNKHKQYPRTDPVVIMLVESADGQRALLGRSAASPAGMYSCLSGFLDQCESIEEAVRREVFEEARVIVGQVQLLGSQPWPIGRAGSCELMLGCLAKALSDDVTNTGELEDVRWCSREDVAAAVRMYDADQCAGGSSGEVQQDSIAQLGFFVPPPFAIAHHLCRIWAGKEDRACFPDTQGLRGDAHIDGMSGRPTEDTSESSLQHDAAQGQQQQQQQQQQQSVASQGVAGVEVSRGRVYSRVGLYSRNTAGMAGGESSCQGTLNSAL